MKKYKSLPCVLGFLLAFVVAATAADAPPLTFKFTPVNVPGATETDPYGISNSDVIVGQYLDQNGLGHGFILDGKKVITIDDPNGTNTVCYGIDPRGAAIVGEYGSGPTGFLYKDGKFIDIPGPYGALLSGATGINDAGEIVGYFSDSNGFSHGFLLKGKTYTTLDVPGAYATMGSGINNHGSIVLSWVDSNGSKASLYDGKKYRTIDVPGAAGSVAEDISTAGDVGYSWWDSAKLLHGALFHGGRYYKFDHPKGIQTYAAGVNDYHVIVGGYQAKSNGPYQGYKATY